MTYSVQNTTKEVAVSCIKAQQTKNIRSQKSMDETDIGLQVPVFRFEKQLADYSGNLFLFKIWI